MRPYEVHKHCWLAVKLSDRTIHFCLCGDESLDRKNPIPARFGTLTTKMKEKVRTFYRDDPKTPIVLETEIVSRQAS